jgi:Rrf2 family iron-sulfur cluster assembly transcriptional regulator
VLITSKSDYGMRAALHLARAGRRVNLHEISRLQHIPYALCAQIMRKLVAAHIVRSMAGPHGGYELAREAKLITISSILQAADRDICIFRCVDDGCDCEFDGKCAFQCVLRAFGRSFSDYLGRLTLEDIRPESAVLPTFTIVESRAAVAAPEKATA